MAKIEIAKSVLFPGKFWDAESKLIFTPDLLGLLTSLHREFEPERKRLLEQRTLRKKYLMKNSKR